MLIASAAQAERPRSYAITGVRIVAAPGKLIESGTVVIRDGIIEAVGATAAVPADAELINGQAGWTVYPAFIDAASGLGLDAGTGTAAPAAGRPAPPARPAGAAHELKAVHPEESALGHIDFNHPDLARHRRMGFAVAQVLPGKGVFRGEAAVITLRPGPAPERVLRDRAAAVIALEASSFMQRQYPSSKFGAVATVRQVLLDAGRQAEWRRRYAHQPLGMEPPEHRSSDDALQALIGHQRPVLWVSIAALDPGRLGSLSREFGLGGALLARDLGDRPRDLLAAGLPLLLPLEMPAAPGLGDPDIAAETSLQALQEALRAPRLPAMLEAEGLRPAFVSHGMKEPQRFTANLAAIVKAGYPADAALAALTTTPAELLGLSRQMGSIEVGKQAHLLVVEGDLFVDKPLIRQLFIAGHRQDLEAADNSRGGRPAGARPSP